LPLAHLIS